MSSAISPCTAPCASLDAADVGQLNASCHCLALPRSTVDQSVSDRWHDQAIDKALQERPHLFASTAVFVSEADWQSMRRQISALEAVFQLPGYQAAIAKRTGHALTMRSPGLFMGYDFHLSAEGPRLIEINTNPGGVLLATAALTAASTQVSVCGSAIIDDAGQVERGLVDMFIDEWRSVSPDRGYRRPQRVAIVDDKPDEQYLYPDMLMMAALLREQGIAVFVVDPSALSVSGKRLLANGAPIDLVYNRLTDFYLTEPNHEALRTALRQRLATISPAPAHHALIADKRNLALIQSAPLAEWGATQGQIETLRALPNAENVTAASAAALWANRRRLFFKPSAGFGGKAVYRGSKMTRKVWEQVRAASYLAQQYVPPGERAAPLPTADPASYGALKFDVRVYTYRGQPLLTTARLYRGQTTNFRTPGGGFAPIVYLK